MPDYSDERARAVFDRDMDEVYAYYQRLAGQQRPAVERAIENLTGHAPADDTGTGERPAAAGEESDDKPQDLAELSAEDALPSDPPQEA